MGREGGGEGTIGRLTWRYGVGDARGTPWTLGTDGNTPGGNIYRVSRFDARGETNWRSLFCNFFFFYRRVVVELGCFCCGRWEFNFDRVRRGRRNVFYVQRKNVFFLFSWEEKVKRERVNLIDEILLIMWKRRMYRVKLFRNFVKIYLF